jgi:carboxylate-amine ligase
MARLDFTVGIEEEYQIIDPESRELTSYVQELLEEGRLVLHEQIKPEFLQSQVEVGSHICRSMREARAELVRLRQQVSRLAKSRGLEMAAASTHPFSSWLTQRITPAERYAKHEAAMADVARRMLIFGMHVHVGIEDRELLIDVMDQARYFLPHLLALSTSSPLWLGRVTGLKSYRSVVFETLPRTGTPPAFRSWGEYQHFLETLVKTRSIEDPSHIWWDMRPHHKFPTLEFRVCDICTRIDDAICLASLMVAIVHKLIRLRRANQSWRRYRTHLIAENKWRAVRFGIDGKLIDFGRQEEVPLRHLAGELLELVDDVVDDLGIRQEVEHIHTILREGTSADRQLEVYRRNEDFKAVVDHLVAETLEGCG